MIMLLYALALGASHWPISPMHAHLILAEMLTETVSLYAFIIHGMLTMPKDEIRRRRNLR